MPSHSVTVADSPGMAAYPPEKVHHFNVRGSQNVAQSIVGCEKRKILSYVGWTCCPFESLF
jgi:hypothetical protein